MTAPILAAECVTKSYAGRAWFTRGRAVKHAVDDVTVEVRTGETLAVVGESGSGKSSLARMLLGLSRPTSGQVLYEGRALASLSGRDLARYRKAVQPVFQDPASSLNPRMRVATTLANVLLRHGLATRATLDAAISALLASVGLDPQQFHDRFPHQLSGGQQQRVAIARALAVQPQVLVADEPLSSLDMSAQAQILKLLIELKTRSRLGLVVISHDLNLVDAIADRVVVMYLGRVVEAGATQDVFSNPAHDYTRSLLAAKLVADPRLARTRRRNGPPTLHPLTPARPSSQA